MFTALTYQFLLLFLGQMLESFDEVLTAFTFKWPIDLPLGDSKQGEC